MSVADRIVGIAVALSPAAHRDVRAEQWRADVRDADEIGLDPTRLALGALTTALFHRRAPRRTSWGDTMTTAPHTIRTVPLLIGLAFAALVVGAASTLVLGRFNGSQWSFIIGYTAIATLCVIPGAFMLGAVFLADRATPRLRAIGALLVVLLALRLGTVMVGAFRIGPDWLWIAVIATGTLATWFVVQRRRGAVWVLLVLPAITLAVLEPTSRAWANDPGLTSPEYWAATWIPLIGPFASALIAGMVSPLVDRGQRSGSVLVDRTV